MIKPKQARLEFGDAAGELALWGERPQATTDDIFGWTPAPAPEETDNAETGA